MEVIGTQKLGANSFYVFTTLSKFAAATREGSVGSTTSVPNDRVSPRAIADCRKRGAPVGSMSSPRPRQCFRLCTRQDMLKKMRAVAAVLMVLSVDTATVVQGFVLVNSNLRALSMYILVVLLVSAALRSVFMTNSFAPTYNRSLDTTAVYDKYL